MRNDTGLTRRDFCRQMAAAGMGLAVGASRPARCEEPSFRLRYTLASCMYGKEPLSRIVPEVIQCGAESIDLWPKSHGDQREQLDAMGDEAFRRLLAEHKVRLAMTTRFDLGPYGLDKEIRKVQELGGTMIVCGSGPVEGTTDKQRIQNFIERIQPHVEVARQHEIILAIENHDSWAVSSPDSLRYFAKMAKSDHLGIALAPYHLPQDEDLLCCLIEDLGPKLVHFYAWQHGAGCSNEQPLEQELLQLPGRGPLDFRPLVASLRTINFSGLTEIFMHPFPRGRPIRDKVEDVTLEIVQARNYLNTCLSD